MNCAATAMNHTDYELRFQSLFDDGRALVFPCDANGRVDLDELSPRARDNYFFARAVVGREFSVPEVQPQACPRAARVSCVAPTQISPAPP